MDPALLDWLSLLVRWFHIIAGIMWIGSSLFFHWLDGALEKPESPQPGLAGQLWMVHSGGFYDLKKKHLQPHEMPPTLHWFRFEALFTWISGIVLLYLVYYLGGGAYLLDRSVSDLTVGQAGALTVGLLAGGWLFYDTLWRAPLPGTVLAGTSFAALLGVAWGLTQLLSGRAAFIHVGALLGTCMVANVWLRILPAQTELLAATRAGRPQDPAPGLRAKARSRHNHYMTYPILFIMISGHYPATYSGPWSWLVLGVLFVAGAGVKYMVNRLETDSRWIAPAVGLAVGSVLGLYLLTAPEKVAASGPTPTWGQVGPIVSTRCAQCHSAHPRDPVFTVPPSGIELDTLEKVRTLAPRVKERSVTLRTMPLANQTGMTDEERALLGAWIDGGMPE